LRVNDDLNTIPGKNTVQGLILAGGQSRRLDGVDKGLLELNGQPLVEHVARVLGPQTARLSVAANRSQSTYQKYATEVLPDAIGGFAGPLAGLATFASVAQSNWVAIVACDLIFLPDDWVGRLLSSAHRRNQNVVCATDKTSGKRALCAVARRECLATAATLLKNDQHRWTDWLASNKAGSELFASQELFNINSHDDVKEAEALLFNKTATY
jgi:molybdenum cofactor guanylyltransferase